MLTSALTEEELASRLAAREAEVATLRARLEKLQSTVTRPVAPHAREELTKKINKYKVTHLGYSVPPCCVPACLPARDVKSHLRYVCMCASLSLSHTHTHTLSLSLSLCPPFLPEQKVWSDRRRIAMEVLDNMAGDERSIKDVAADAKVETDADAGVDLRAF